VPPLLVELLLELDEPPDDDEEEDDEPPELLPELLDPPELLLLEELLLLSGSLEHPCAASTARETTIAGRTVRRYFIPDIVST